MFQKIHKNKYGLELILRTRKFHANFFKADSMQFLKFFKKKTHFLMFELCCYASICSRI